MLCRWVVDLKVAEGAWGLLLEFYAWVTVPDVQQ